MTTREWPYRGRPLSVDEFNEMRSRIDAWWLPEKRRLLSGLLSSDSFSGTSPRPGRDEAFYRCGPPSDATRLLDEACSTDDLHALRVALDNGADPDIQFDGEGSMNPLEKAIISKCLKTAALLASVCDPSAMTSMGEPLLFIAALWLEDGDPLFETIRGRGRPFTAEYRCFMAEIAERNKAA